MAAGVFPWPELLVASASAKFEGGRLTDEPTREFLKDYLRGFTAWVAKQRA